MKGLKRQLFVFYKSRIIRSHDVDQLVSVANEMKKCMSLRAHGALRLSKIITWCFRVLFSFYFRLNLLNVHSD